MFTVSRLSSEKTYLTGPLVGFYGWWVVGAAATALFTVMSTNLYAVGTYFVALERHFGWSRTALSGAFSLARLEGAVLGPIEGILTDRFGPRRMLIIGFSIMGAGFILLSLIQSIVGFYVAFILITTGAGLGGYLPMMTIVNNWFSRRRATAMSVTMMGISAGGLVTPVIAWSITYYGWRPTVAIIGILVWIMAIPVSSVLRDRPEDYGLQPDGILSDGEGTPVQTGDSRNIITTETDFTVGQALRTPVFWIISFAHASNALLPSTLSVHLIPMLTDSGLSLEMAALVITGFAFIQLPFRLVGGYAGDRLPKPIVLFTFSSMMSIGLLVVTLNQNMPSLFLFAFLYGAGIGARSPVFTAIRGEYFGRRAYATILGTSQLATSVFSIGAPVLVGFMFDTLGSYVVPFSGMSLLSLVGVSLILVAKKPELERAH
ncbi:MFS transporter [SAR202 cluster bacterium AC-647-N09_OGT_505m]|nr:MFS transporter [SAR202 cluster bacterium AC-647-N09_OGT_505m]